MNVYVMGLRGFPQIEGGVEKHCELLYPEMDDSVKLTVCRRRVYVTPGVNDKSTYSNIEFLDLPSTKVKGLEVVLNSFIATRKLAKIKPDLVHIHNIGPSLFAAKLKKKGIPLVVTYHSANYEHAKWGTFAKKLLLYCEKVALKNADKIIFVNRFQMEKYSDEVRQRSVFIPNGIKPPVFSQNTDFLEELGVEPGKYVLSVGRITPEKGFDTLIKAFNQSQHDGYKLVIAGGVEFESGYMDELKKLGGDVIFTGYVYGDKLAQLYTNAGLYVLASRNEGFPLVLLEAMSYRLDVIASDIPGTHLVKLNEDDYFPCGDDKALSGIITQRLADPKNREYELDEFNWHSIAQDTVAVYQDVLRKRDAQ